jgi:2-methylisocitrate lyase-like PEP mutase family enzyme
MRNSQTAAPQIPRIPESPSSNFAARREAFRKLHESGCFVIPNPWDPGTARYLRHLGFKALATTSGGFAFSRGLPDAAWAASRDMVLDHVAEIVAAVELPVNADFQAGYADEPDGVAANVRLCVQTGVAGLSIEDATGRREQPLYELPLAVARIKAARAAIDASGADVLLTARAECYLVGHPDPLPEAIRRLQAYAEAGADVLYAPGPRTADEIQSIVNAVSPKPVNVLVSSNTGLKIADLAAMGVRRVSVGSALARAAWTGFIRAARKIVDEGSMEGFDGSIPFSELEDFFEKDFLERSS